MTSVYELSSGRRPARAESCELSPDWLTDGVARWVRMVDPPQHELEAGLRVLDLPEEFLKTPEGDDTQPRVVVQGRMVLVMMPVHMPAEAHASILRVICTPTALITVEEKASPAIDGIVAELHHRERAAAAPPGLLIDVLQAAVTNAGLTRPH